MNICNCLVYFFTPFIIDLVEFLVVILHVFLQSQS